MTQAVAPELAGVDVNSTNLQNLIVFRLASLESTVTSNFRRIDEKIDQFKNEINHKYVNNAAEIAAAKAVFEKQLEREIEKREILAKETCERLDSLEKFKTETLTRVSLIAGGIALAWMIFGEAVQNALGIQ